MLVWQKDGGLLALRGDGFFDSSRKFPKFEGEIFPSALENSPFEGGWFCRRQKPGDVTLSVLTSPGYRLRRHRPPSKGEWALCACVGVAERRCTFGFEGGWFFTGSRKFPTFEGEIFPPALENSLFEGRDLPEGSGKFSFRKEDFSAGFRKFPL